MSRLNKIEQNNQISSSFCFCLKEKISKYNELDIHNSVSDKQDYQKTLTSRKENNGRKNVGLKLSKNLFEAYDLNNNLERKVNNFGFLQSSENFENSINKILNKNQIVNEFTQFNKLRKNKNVNIAQSQFYTITQNFENIYSIQKDRKSQIIYQQRIIDNQINRPWIQSGKQSKKITSTSSTTLYDTKKQFQQLLHNKQMELTLHRQNNFAKQAQSNPRTQKRNNLNNEFKYLNTIDFSCVRKVQTIRSQDSLSMSFLDMESELDLQQIQKQVNYKQIQIQMKKLLQN